MRDENIIIEMIRYGARLPQRVRVTARCAIARDARKR